MSRIGRRRPVSNYRPIKTRASAGAGGFFNIPGVETATGTESAVVVAVIAGAADTAVGVDSARVLVQAADTIASIEGAGIQRADTDAATGTDTATRRGYLADTATGADNAIVIIKLTETISSIEGAGLLRATAETVSAAENATVRVLASDTANAVDFNAAVPVGMRIFGERVVRIKPAPRVLAIAADSRTVRVAAGLSRTYTIPPDPGTLS